MNSDEQPVAGETADEFNRRRGDRRESELPAAEPAERRADDRRRNKPGFFGLIDALLGKKD